MTKSQIERLGVRLVQGENPTHADLELLHEVLGLYSEVLVAAVERVRESLGVSPTVRVKNTGTIVEKLRRNGGHGLKSIQDLAGMRIVVRSDRRRQDAIVEQLVTLFGEDARPPKVVDRRVDPVHGYRAVHVIAFPEGVPVEIQVRTLWQHEWAELFEKLADRVGRGIRYGDAPARWWTPSEFERMDEATRRSTSARYELRVLTVHAVLRAAWAIDAIEITEITAAMAPNNPSCVRPASLWMGCSPI